MKLRSLFITFIALNSMISICFGGSKELIKVTKYHRLHSILLRVQSAKKIVKSCIPFLASSFSMPNSSEDLKLKTEVTDDSFSLEASFHASPIVLRTHLGSIRLEIRPPQLCTEESNLKEEKDTPKTDQETDNYYLNTSFSTPSIALKHLPTGHVSLEKTFTL